MPILKILLLIYRDTPHKKNMDESESLKVYRELDVWRQHATGKQRNAGFLKTWSERVILIAYLKRNLVSTFPFLPARDIVPLFVSSWR